MGPGNVDTRIPSWLLKKRRDLDSVDEYCAALETSVSVQKNAKLIGQAINRFEIRAYFARLDEPVKIYEDKGRQGSQLSEGFQVSFLNGKLTPLH